MEAKQEMNKWETRLQYASIIGIIFIPPCAYVVAQYLLVISPDPMPFIEQYAFIFFALWFFFMTVAIPIVSAKCNFRKIYDFNNKSIITAAIASIIGFLFPFYYGGYYPLNKHILDDPTIFNYIVIYVVHAVTGGSISLAVFSLFSFQQNHE
ncbi:hypothetical protein PsW64_04749 [Pseudovibrio sp. W64]|uniref:hypothetical protein n=1 Tax=unclassified Pseudovibrio TaxID=2627060 RepID=UPI0007AE6589|nr:MULTISPECIES: hypothetical protein [unclassified Pseudovibrio]KZK76904.1 hypothetical protein PsW64_04749 [Pseudovibrio sp. W64]KZL26995.1 hypothetical protein PsAD37_01671 [Pseudovibrio sp. Ad37]